ncbi:WAT1-related protein [Tanacetum coccineum]|uniref:WAT1-related protein n=1 Tax=Tanacetum coccineum TaxID=301880 RepID=A0ABQ5E5H2_9ASTR
MAFLFLGPNRLASPRVNGYLVKASSNPFTFYDSPLPGVNTPWDVMRIICNPELMDVAEVVQSWYVVPTGRVIATVSIKVPTGRLRLIALAMICVSRQNEVVSVSLDFPANLEPSSSLRQTGVSLIVSFFKVLNELRFGATRMDKFVVEDKLETLEPVDLVVKQPAGRQLYCDATFEICILRERPVVDQNLFYAGMKYITTTFAVAMGNIIPAMTFLMAWACMLEKVNIKKMHNIRKIVGTLVTAGEEPEEEPKEGTEEVTEVSPITPPPLSESSSDSEFTALITTNRTAENAATRVGVNGIRGRINAYDIDLAFIEQDATRTSDDVLALQEGRARDQESMRKLERRVDVLEGVVEARPNESIDFLAVYEDAQRSEPQGPPDGSQ